MDLRYSDAPVMSFKGQSDKSISSVSFNVKKKRKEVVQEIPNRNQREFVKEEDSEDKTQLHGIAKDNNYKNNDRINQFDLHKQDSGIKQDSFNNTNNLNNKLYNERSYENNNA